MRSDAGRGLRFDGTLAFSAGRLAALRRVLLDDAPLEAAAFLLASYSGFGEHACRLVVTEIINLSPSDYLSRSPWSIELTAQALADATKRARANGQTLILTHTHPGGIGATASQTDRASEREWIQAVSRRVPNAPHGRLILGTLDSTAALVAADGSERQLRIIEVGSVVKQYSEGDADGFDRTLNDRQIRAFGEEGQRRLQGSHVGIVGLGGTGSVVAQQLAHLGVGRLTFVDPDVVEVSNLNRVVGATPTDVGRLKVDVAKEAVMRIAPAIVADGRRADVRDASATRTLLGCDLVFCCTDSEGSRAVLNQMAYQFCLPTIDLGVAIVTRAGRVTHISGRVQLLSPGEPCLICCNALDPEQVRRDLLTDEDRARDQYILGAAVAQPSVISINTATAGLAVTMMLAVMTSIPVGARHQRLRLETGVVSRVAVEPAPACPICSSGGVLGRGDTWAPPGRR